MVAHRFCRCIRRRRSAVTVVVLLVAVSLAAAASAASAGRIVYTNVVPKKGSKEFTVRVHKAAAFSIRLQVPTQGRARLYLSGATAPSGGPLFDTKTGCEGTAGSIFCEGSFEPLPAGLYTFKVRWDGPAKARFQLTVRWG